MQYGNFESLSSGADLRNTAGIYRGFNIRDPAQEALNLRDRPRNAESPTIAEVFHTPIPSLAPSTTTLTMLA
jgi:hypothetical protein